MSGPLPGPYERQGTDLPDDWDPDAGDHEHGGHDYRHDLAGDHDLADDHEPEGGGYVPRHGPPRRRRHPVLAALAVAVAVLVVVVVGGLLWAHRQIDPGRPGTKVTVVIPSGSSTSKIGQDLAKAGVVHDATLFAFYVRLHGGAPLLPGTYTLPKNSSYSAAIAALQSGPIIVTDTLVIPEGFTLAEIAARVGALPHLGLSGAKFLADAHNGTVRSPYEPAGSNDLEGLLFPATYQVRQGQSESDVLSEMVDTFDQNVQSLGIASAAAKVGVTPYQLVTVASIVQEEAKLPPDLPNVASTIYNRLRIGMKLGADSTQTYYLRKSNPNVQPTAAQLDQPGPYNTRLIAGLPPTPIANPGLAALQAAAHPPTTQYLYFVEVNPDGQLGFATDDAGFVRLQQECRAAHLC